MVQPVNGVTLICAWEPCGQSFTVFPSQVKKAKYCSRPCQWLATAAGRSKKVTLTCAFPPCGKTFQTFAYKMQEGIAHRCCSRKCKTSLIMMRKYPGTFEEKFWAQVAIAGPDECWPWQGRTGRGSYGMIYVPETQIDTGTHIVAFHLAHGRWPLPGMNVCHSCDFPPCCNERHLWEGTDLDNVRDAVSKGRHVTQTQPGIGAEALRQWHREHPEAVPRGERHGSRTHPERIPRGERNGKSKLTDAQAEEAIALYATDAWTLAQLGARYGVTGETIRYRIQSHRKAL